MGLLEGDVVTGDWLGSEVTGEFDGMFEGMDVSGELVGSENSGLRVGAS